MDQEDLAAPGGDVMENTAEPASPVRVCPPRASPAPISLVRTADPLQPTAASSADVGITGLGFSAPTEPVTLARHTAKEEKFQQDKGKWSTDLSSYAQFGAQELHSRYLNRLFTRRDYEASLVNMMKEKYEVTFFPFASRFCLYFAIIPLGHSSPQVPVYFTVGEPGLLLCLRMIEH